MNTQIKNINWIILYIFICTVFAFRLKILTFNILCIRVGHPPSVTSATIKKSIPAKVGKDCANKPWIQRTSVALECAPSEDV